MKIVNARIGDEWVHWNYKEGEDLSFVDEYEIIEVSEEK
jgi:hypothetical protein